MMNAHRRVEVCLGLFWLLPALWATASEETARGTRAHEGSIAALAFSPIGDRWVSAGADGVIRVWNAAGDICLAELRGHRGPVYALAITPDKHLVSSAGHDGDVRVWSLAEFTCVRTLTPVRIERDAGPAAEALWEPGVRAVTFSADGRFLAAGGGDGTATVWDTSTYAARRFAADPASVPG